jgi:cell wall assembly regulator SMI1
MRLCRRFVAHAMSTCSTSLWEQFEVLLERHAPEFAQALRPPARAQDIAEAEYEMGVRLPPAVRHAYLRHDGMFGPNSSFWDCDRPTGRLFGSCAWISLELMVRDWKSQRTHDNGECMEPTPALDSPRWLELDVQTSFSHPLLVPIGMSGTATQVYVDLVPGPKGTYGQLIAGDGVDGRPVMAHGFDEHITGLVEGMRSGRLVYSTDERAWQAARN